MRVYFKRLFSVSILITTFFASYALSVTASAPKSTAPEYMFNVMGDMQMGDGNIYDEENYENALRQVKSISPETEAVLTVGDNTNNGTEDQYKVLKRIKESVIPDIPVYYAIGNHDRALRSGTGPNDTEPSVWRDRFIKYAKDMSGCQNINNVYYSFMLADSYVIMLGSEVTSRNDNCNDVFVSDAQYDWFESEMKKASQTGNPIYVIFHEPFKNTVSGSLPGQNWQGNPVNPYYYKNNRYEDLKKVADRYPQTIVFSGHTHWSFTTKQPVLLTDGKTHATYVNCASVGYLWYDNLTGRKDQQGKWTGSEGLFVYVYKDRVEIKGRDFINGKWLLDVEVPVLRTGNAETPKPTATAGVTPSHPASATVSGSHVNTPSPSKTPAPEVTPTETPVPSPTPGSTQKVTQYVTQEETPTETPTETPSGAQSATASGAPSGAPSASGPAAATGSQAQEDSASSGTGTSTLLIVATVIMSATAVAAGVFAGMTVYKSRKKL